MRHFIRVNCGSALFIFRYVLGHDAMKRMLSSSVLLIGLGGLGVEIAKNLVLAGIHSLIIYDETAVTIQDLGSQVLDFLIVYFSTTSQKGT